MARKLIQPGQEPEGEREFTTKDSGKRQTFTTGMQRDSGEKDLYRELYGSLMRCLYTPKRYIGLLKEQLMVNLQEYCNVSANRLDLERIVILVHDIESLKLN